MHVAAVEHARCAGAGGGGRGKTEFHGRVESVAAAVVSGVAISGHQRTGTPRTIDQLNPVAGRVDLGHDVHGRGALGGVVGLDPVVNGVDHALQRGCRGQVDVDGVSVAIGELHVAQGPQPLAAVEIGKEHGLQTAKDGAAGNGVGFAGTDQPQVAGGGGPRGIGDRKRVVAIRAGQSRVRDHQTHAGNRGLQCAAALAVDLLDHAAQRGLAGEIDRARRAVVQGVVDVAQRGWIDLNAQAVVEGLEQHGVQPARDLAARNRSGRGGIDQSQVAGGEGARGIGDRELVAGILAGHGRVGDHQVLAGERGLQLAAALAVDLLDDVVERRIAAELREVDRALGAIVQGVAEVAQGEGVHLHAHAVVQGAKLDVAGERQNIRAGDRICRRVRRQIDVG